jgi:hypothetical protein
MKRTLVLKADLRENWANKLINKMKTQQPKGDTSQDTPPVPKEQ